MPAIGERLRHYADAISDPTRGRIVLELDRVGELTATQLAQRLGLGVNNVYHHMRVLLTLDVVDPPRRVPGETYVEKYYQINPELRAAIRLDPTWYIQVQSSLTPEDRQALLVSVSLTMANLLRQAATRYSEMDAETLDQSIQEDQLAMTVIAWMGREQLRSRLERIRAVLEEEDREEAETVTRGTDVMLIAALPALWENETHQEREVSAQPPSSE